MFRFTIRDVLWLTVVVGLALGWWTQAVTNSDWVQRVIGENQRLRHKNNFLIEELHNARPPVISNEQVRMLKAAKSLD